MLKYSEEEKVIESRMQEKPLKTWFHERRHIEVIKGDIDNINDDQAEWRKIKDRMKTVSVALVLCLNIGVDPPDLVKPPICARREAWVDPALMNPIKAPQKIAQMLQKSYERLQPRARYKAAIDPTIDYLKKLCTGMRRSAKDERVLFHYNGHGVPRPTESGEIWVFNKHITQYIPLSLYDLQTYMGTPSVYVWDTHNAGLIVKNFKKFANERYNTWEKKKDKSSDEKPPYFRECIHLAACDVNELLPVDPNLPADLFTSCLTTPINTSMLWYVLKTNTKDKYPLQMIESLPGSLTDRKTILGELNWIFTAITDTIAWSRLPKDKFQKLFRQDLLVASLFRSFLLAEKIMCDHGCKVVSEPEIPSVYDHPLWDYWEYTIELCLINLYNNTKMYQPKNSVWFTQKDCFVNTQSLSHVLLVELHNNHFISDDLVYNYFFVEQLQAFDIWLRFDNNNNKIQAPEQLPIILQVLLSQVHRIKALELLARFLDIGSWAVLEALFVGVFPYVLKLLQSGTLELRPSLTFIWAKILIVDPKCSEDLLKDQNYLYFIDIVKDKDVLPRYKIIPVFVLCTLMKHEKDAQVKFFEAQFIETAVELLIQPQVMDCKMLCIWLLIGCGRLWNNFDQARWSAVRTGSDETVINYLLDDVPEVRAAAVFALGQLMTNRSSHNDHATSINNDIIDKIVASCAWDGSVLVRLELAVAIQWYVLDHLGKFAEQCIEMDRKFKDEKIDPYNTIHSTSSMRFNSNQSTPNRRTVSSGSDYVHNLSYTSIDTSQNSRNYLHKQWKKLESRSINSPFERVWKVLLRLYFDPMRQVRDLARILVDHVLERAENIRKNLIMDSPRATFTIGSPGTIEPMDTTSRKYLRSKEKSSSSTNNDPTKTLDRVETSSSTLIAKRKIYGSRTSESKTPKDLDFLQPIIVTEFVEWSGKIFNKTIYKTLYDEFESDSKDWMVDGRTCYTSKNPSDWAIHTAEGLEQHATADMDKLRENKASFQSTPFVFPLDKKVYCMEWSYLRPYVYICDGRVVYAYDTQNKTKPYESRFKITVNDDPLFEDPLTDIILVNEKNLELMICGTRDGLISIWDPQFDEHSYDVDKEPKMLTSNFLFNDQSRLFNNYTKNGKKHEESRTNHTLYKWDQNCGYLLCGGNVKVARIWDAWSEKRKMDFELPRTYGITTSLCADYNYELVTLGFDTGAIAAYDTRIESQVFGKSIGIRTKIVGTSFLNKTNIVSVGYEDGKVMLYDLRQFDEPLLKFEVTDLYIEPPKVTSSPLSLFISNNNVQPKKVDFKLSVNSMVVQQSNNVIGCSLNDGSVRLYDVNEIHKSKYLGHVLYPGLSYPTKENPLNAFKFHPKRGQFGVVTNQNVFALYTVT